MNNNDLFPTTSDLRNSNMANRQFDDGGELLNLCLNLYGNQPLTDKNQELVNNLVIEPAQFILTSGRRFLHPPRTEVIPLDQVMEMQEHDTSGIFCRRIDKNRLSGEQPLILCTTLLGRDKKNNKILAAILYPSGWGDIGLGHNRFYDLIAEFKNYWRVFTNSSAIKNFITDESSFSYIIDPKTGTILSQHLPKVDGLQEEIFSWNNRIAREILPKFVNPEFQNSNEEIINSSLKSFSSKSFKLLNFEYALLSFQINLSINRALSEDNTVIQSFSHKIRNKLGTLQTAASQLTLQENKPVNKDDIILAEIIQSETDFICGMIDRLELYYTRDEHNPGVIDLNQIIADMIKTWEFSDQHPLIEFIPDPKPCQINGDSDQIRTALDEILKNAVESGGKIKVSTSAEDDVSILIKNELTKSQIETLNKESFDFLEPFISKKPEKVGLGLNIARRVFTNLGGKLEISEEQTSDFSVKINIPLNTTGSNKLGE